MREVRLPGIIPILILGLSASLKPALSFAEQIQTHGLQPRPAQHGGWIIPYFDVDLSVWRRESALYDQHVARTIHQRGRVETPAKEFPSMLSESGVSQSAALGVPKPAEGRDGVLPGLPRSLIAVMEGGRLMGPVVPVMALPTPSVLPAPARSSGVPGAVSPVSVSADILQGENQYHRGLFLPFEKGVGAAAFSRGDDVFVVFDTARPLDLSGVQASALGERSSIQLLPEATVLRLTGRASGSVSLRRLPAGWLVQDGVMPRVIKDIEPVREGANLKFVVDQPGRTVIVPDPMTGSNLLIGTVRDGSSAMLETHLGSSVRTDRTIAGLVVAPLSDTLELHPAAGAFILSGMVPDALAIVAGRGSVETRGAAPSRIMSLDPGSIQVLKRRLNDALADAAAAPAEARFLPRLRAAEAALALGDGRTAATIIHVAIADDPRAAALPRPRLVAAAAALLDHQPGQAGILDDLGSHAIGEAGLWRAVMLAERGSKMPEAARLFSANLGLLESYPQPLQAVLLPLAAETMVRAGTDAQARVVATLPHATSLELSRGLLDERLGKAASALSILDRLAKSSDWVLGDEAAGEATSIREKSAGADPRRLADFLESRLLDARIAGHEPDSLLHLADLRTRAGQWRKALDLLREVAHRFPEREPAARRQIAEVLRRLITAPPTTGAGPLVDQAALIESNSDLLPSGPEGTEVSLFLAEKLAALDLPEQAARIVRRMMQAAPPGVVRAKLGMKLAGLEFQQNDLAGVQAALRGSQAGDIPPPLAASRSVMTARALAGEGQFNQALGAIASLNTESALDLKARLYAQRHDWNASADCLVALTRQRLAGTGELDPAAQDLLLRLAAAASRIGDTAHIEQARALGDRRWSSAEKRALFQVLTSAPVSGTTELAQVTAELEQLRSSRAAIESVSQ